MKWPWKRPAPLPAKERAEDTTHSYAKAVDHTPSTPATNTLREQVALRVGTLDQFLAAHGYTREKYIEERIARNDKPPAGAQPGSQGYEAWLNRELDDAVSKATAQLAKDGHTAQTFEKVRDSAKRRDNGRTFIKGLFANVLAYGVAGVVGLVLSAALAPLGIAGVVIGIGAASALALTWSAISLSAGGEVNKEFAKSNPDYIKAIEPQNLRQALKTEALSEVLGRTGLRAAITWPLRILRMTSSALAGPLGKIVGPLGVAIASPTTSLMQVGSLMAKRHYNGSSTAPMVGISISEAGISFSASDYETNKKRLAQSAVKGAAETVGDLWSFFSGERASPGFLAELKKAASNFPNVSQATEGVLGSNFVGNGVSSLAGGLGSTAVGSAVAMTSTLTGLLNLGTRGAIGNNWSLAQRLKAYVAGAPSAAAASAKPAPASASVPAFVPVPTAPADGVRQAPLKPAPVQRSNEALGRPQGVQTFGPIFPPAIRHGSAPVNRVSSVAPQPHRGRTSVFVPAPIVASAAVFRAPANATAAVEPLRRPPSTAGATVATNEPDSPNSRASRASQVSSIAELLASSSLQRQGSGASFYQDFSFGQADAERRTPPTNGNTQAAAQRTSAVTAAADPAIPDIVRPHMRQPGYFPGRAIS